MLHALDNPALYNIALSATIRPSANGRVFDPKILYQALSLLMARHEMLRATIELSDDLSGWPMIVIHQTMKPNLIEIPTNAQPQQIHEIFEQHANYDFLSNSSNGTR